MSLTHYSFYSKDKFKIECEKLLMQLKQVKLEWAFSEETYD